MNRRRFLAYGVGVAMSVAVADELLGTRRIFLPPRGGWYGRQIGDMAINVHEGFGRLVVWNGEKWADVPPPRVTHRYILADDWDGRWYGSSGQ